MPGKPYSEWASRTRDILLYVGLEAFFEIQDLSSAGLRPSECLDCGEHSVSVMVEHVEVRRFQAIRNMRRIERTHIFVAEQGCDYLETICARNGTHNMILSAASRSESTVVGHR